VIYEQYLAASTADYSAVYASQEIPNEAIDPDRLSASERPDAAELQHQKYPAKAGD